MQLFVLAICIDSRVEFYLVHSDLLITTQTLSCPPGKLSILWNLWGQWEMSFGGLEVEDQVGEVITPLNIYLAGEGLLS